MIKNKNLQMGLLVFVLTLIGLIVFAEFYSENNLDDTDKQSVTTEGNVNEKLEIAVK